MGVAEAFHAEVERSLGEQRVILLSEGMAAINEIVGH
jgi:hypothetical protein